MICCSFPGNCLVCLVDGMRKQNQGTTSSFVVKIEDGLAGRRARRNQVRPHRIPPLLHSRIFVVRQSRMRIQGATTTTKRAQDSYRRQQQLSPSPPLSEAHLYGQLLRYDSKQCCVLLDGGSGDFDGSHRLYRGEWRALGASGHPGGRLGGAYESHARTRKAGA